MFSINRRELAVAIMGGTLAASTSTATANSDSAKKSNDAAECVRANLKDNLESRFKEFLGHASIGDLYFMGEVLLTHNGDSLGIHANEPELALPAAFEIEMGRDVPCFVAVPEHLQGDVQRLVRGLLSAERKG